MVQIEGVGAVKEWPKKGRVRRVDHVWSAWGRIPVGLGKDVILRCISDACGRDAGNVMGLSGEVP